MPALKPTDYFGEIIWLGQVGNRDAGLRSTSAQSLSLGPVLCCAAFQIFRMFPHPAVCKMMRERH